MDRAGAFQAARRVLRHESCFSAVAGNVVGPLIGYEVLTAFFFEATFLSVLLFGAERLPRWLHVFRLWRQGQHRAVGGLDPARQ
jgi:hypothetical protein